MSPAQLKLSLFFMAIMAMFFGTTARAAQFSRPPQYVLLAFDGSSAISMWQTTRKFAQDSTAKGQPLKFTYFISGVYYVGKNHKSDIVPGTANPVYIAPQHGASSAIGWGGDSNDLLARYDQTNLAHQEGNEIGSHAVGHWDGTTWSYSGWTSEFSQFATIIAKFFEINVLKPSAAFPSGWLFPVSSIVGFRAPQLGINSSLYQVLKDTHYRYDTSKTANANYWPAKKSSDEPWNFPLAMLRIAGTGKRTLSMDYNFYFADSAALPKPENKAIYKKQMLDTYLHYFESNYNGNRAPVNIGHHFSLWNDGAYWDAMQEFAAKVCGMPEVKCVTYRELADYMDTLTPQQIQDYQAGKFDPVQSAPIRLTMADPGYELDASLVLIRDVAGMNSPADRVRVSLKGDGIPHVAGAKIVYTANGVLLRSEGRDLNLSDVRNLYRGQNVTLRASLVSSAGVEIARATQLLLNTGEHNELLSSDVEENRALLGDLPEAHQD